MGKMLMLGNEAIALGLLEQNCRMICAYPGTPSSEILSSVLQQKKRLEIDLHAEWSVNEKVALEVALGGSWSGLRSAAIMKQVGLNVASDAFFSAAYQGVKSGFLIIPADDPGPSSSQTEQDSRLMALTAKVPVFDPSTPQEAREFVKHAMELSERHQVPVMLRPTRQICHAVQDIDFDEEFSNEIPQVKFDKDPHRWAATPRDRYLLHVELNKKLKLIEDEFSSSHCNKVESGSAKVGVIASGMVYNVARQILRDLNFDAPLLKIGTPFPLPQKMMSDFIADCEQVVVFEETDYCIELQIPDRRNVRGRLDSTIPSAGELTPDVVGEVLSVLQGGENKTTKYFSADAGLAAAIAEQQTPPRPPRLCPGCSHRSAFYAMKREFGKRTLYPGDIGCYTLGANLDAVDTCVDMGSGSDIASGFYHAHKIGRAGGSGGKDRPIMVTIGDSTFLHSGLQPLMNAVHTDARFVLLILDNRTTAMTGFQPTPANPEDSNLNPERSVSIPNLVRACGVEFVRELDPYLHDDFRSVIREAHEHCRSPEGRVAVVIAERSCSLHEPETVEKRAVQITDECDGCRYCLIAFECPALVLSKDGSRVDLNEDLCVDCGQCIDSCHKGFIIPHPEMEWV